MPALGINCSGYYVTLFRNFLPFVPFSGRRRAGAAPSLARNLCNPIENVNILECHRIKSNHPLSAVRCPNKIWCLDSIHLIVSLNGKLRHLSLCASPTERYSLVAFPVLHVHEFRETNDNRHFDVFSRAHRLLRRDWNINRARM